MVTTSKQPGGGEESPVPLPFSIEPQPTDSTCGPTCLHGVYRFFGDEVPLSQVIAQVPQLDTGGTLAVLLGIHALRRHYHARIYTLNLQVFDPTWFPSESTMLSGFLRAQAEAKPHDQRLQMGTQAYLTFLELGGEVNCQDFTEALVRKHLNRNQPVLTGLSATYLYWCARESGEPSRYDTLRGSPTGHFVVLHGYQPHSRLVHVADPLRQNPLAPQQQYQVRLDRLLAAVLLGVLTFDANMLVIWPKHHRKDH